MNASNPIVSPESPLQMQWREDRALRQRVRLSQSWRGCMGLAVLLDPTLAPRDWFPRPHLGFDHATRNALPSAIPGQVFRLSNRPDRVYFPAYVVARDVRNVPPVNLIWDIAPAQRYFDSTLMAAVFPPLRLRSWDRLRWNLGEVDLDARIADQRLQTDMPGQSRVSVDTTPHEASPVEIKRQAPTQRRLAS